MFTAGFTDPQGTEYEAAVFQVFRSEFSGSSSETYRYDVVEDEGTLDNRSSYSVSYRVVYWPSQEHRDNGASPYILIDPATYGSDFAGYSLDASVYQGLSAEAAAEEHCRREIIGVSTEDNAGGKE